MQVSKTELYKSIKMLQKMLKRLHKSWQAVQEWLFEVYFQILRIISK